MPRALVLGNGQLGVTLDEFGFVRDFYYPYIGLENHVSGMKHRIGVSVNDTFSWLDDGSWSISLGYKPGTMIGYLVCKNSNLKISLVMEDAVYNETNIFLRKVDIYNHSDHNDEIKLFFHQVFAISESRKRNTAFYDPTHNAVVHYKGPRVFIINGQSAGGNGIDDYSVGAYQSEGKLGTYLDAEDGELSKNAVEHGSVDSVVRFCANCERQQKTTIYYWICAGESLDSAYKLNNMVLEKTPAGMVHSTERFWNAWVKDKDFDLADLSDDHLRLFHTSLFVLRSHFDNRGSVIASVDSEMIEYGKDDYTYMWPRDAAFIVLSLDRAGYDEVTKPFFDFCKDVLHEDGYLHHRFRSDRTLGSTWHSTIAQHQWLKDKILQLPIQEDESASVIFALWHHYKWSKDTEFIENLYKPLIEKVANFLVHFRYESTGLPLYSYDLWEEKIGINTYTCASVYGGLMAAANFCELLGKRNHMRLYRDTAKEIKQAVIDHLFDPEINAFVRVAYYENGQVIREKVVDSATLFGMWYFGMFDQSDSYFQATQQAVERELLNPTPLGGYIRYQHDNYFKSTDLSNPWVITTLWLAQMRLEKETCTQADLDYVKQTLDWVLAHRSPSGVLGEQFNPHTQEFVSATPLVWSHAVYVETVLKYAQRRIEVEQEAAGSLRPPLGGE